MATLQTHNPATGEVLADLEITPDQEIDRMVQRAKTAQKSWGAKSVRERADVIVKAYGGIKARKKELGELIHREMGKTLEEAVGEVDGYSSRIEIMANEVVEALTPTESISGGRKTTTYYDPLGVCASITPWNFPMGMPHTLMMPSLMAGNTILFKPSEEVPLIGIEYAKILNEVFPPDVLQVVIGTGEQGKKLVQSDVQLITFTGSQGTGKNILENAGKDLKRVLLELGGKDPLIVLEDADVDAAAAFAVRNSFRNTGQVCVSTEQIYVAEKIYQPFVNKLKALASDFPVGAMIHKRQEDHVRRQVREAVKDGATLELGDVDATALKPIILTGVKPDMNIMVDETFGPVACIASVKDEAEAVDLANRSNYALGAAVFGQDRERAKRVGRQLKSGMVGINSGVGGSPWVGAGQSGYGFHGSAAGHRQFAQVRTLTEDAS